MNVYELYLLHMNFIDDVGTENVSCKAWGIVKTCKLPSGSEKVFIDSKAWLNRGTLYDAALLMYISWYVNTIGIDHPQHVISLL